MSKNNMKLLEEKLEIELMKNMKNLITSYGMDGNI